MDICRVCDGSCCKTINLLYRKSGRSLYKNTPHLRDYPFLKRTGKYFTCDNYDEEKGLCKDYENRPNFCRNFICNEAIEILTLVLENPFPIIEGI